MQANPVTTVDEYIKHFSRDVQTRLKVIRNVIRKVAPQSVESISYGMPAYKLHGKPLVYFAAYEHHIGFYATPAGHRAFAQQLSQYKQGKGSVQFPHVLPLPLKLIERMIRFRAQ